MVEIEHAGVEARVIGTIDAFTAAVEALRREADGTASVGSRRAGSRVEIQVDSAQQKLLVTAGDDPALKIVAGKSGLQWLAATAERFATGQIPGGATHLHIEHFEGHPMLAPESIPLVLELSG